MYSHYHKKGVRKYILLDRTLSRAARCATGFDLGSEYTDSYSTDLPTASINKLVQGLGFAKGTWKLNAYAFHTGQNKWANVYRTPELSAYVDTFTQQESNVRSVGTQTSIAATSFATQTDLRGDGNENTC